MKFLTYRKQVRILVADEILTHKEHMPQKSNGSPPRMATANDKQLSDARWQAQGSVIGIKYSFLLFDFPAVNLHAFIWLLWKKY